MRRDLTFVRDFAQTIEGLGFRTLSLPEHVVFFPEYESDYPYTDDGEPNWGPDTGILIPFLSLKRQLMRRPRFGLLPGF